MRQFVPANGELLLGRRKPRNGVSLTPFFGPSIIKLSKYSHIEPASVETRSCLFESQECSFAKCHPPRPTQGDRRLPERGVHVPCIPMLLSSSGHETCKFLG